jgi:hypothetical protein
VRKLCKKITFKLDNEVMRAPREVAKKASRQISKTSTAQTLKKCEGKVVREKEKPEFPSDFSEMIKILKGLR